MKRYKVWVTVNMHNFPKQAKILTSTWVMKKKLNAIFGDRINGRLYEQVGGIHYYGSSIHSPVSSDVRIIIAMILVLVSVWDSQIVDVKGAFLNGDLDDSEKVHTHFPQGFKKYYPSNVVLILLKSIYGIKQAAMQFWK